MILKFLRIFLLFLKFLEYKVWIHIWIRRYYRLAEFSAGYNFERNGWDIRFVLKLISLAAAHFPINQYYTNFLLYLLTISLQLFYGCWDDCSGILSNY